MNPGHLIPEGEYINGTGISVEYSALKREVIIVVTSEEVAMNPLARAWVEALQNAAKQGERDREIIRRHYERPPVYLGRQKQK